MDRFFLAHRRIQARGTVAIYAPYILVLTILGMSYEKTARWRNGTGCSCILGQKGPHGLYVGGSKYTDLKSPRQLPQQAEGIQHHIQNKIQWLWATRQVRGELSTELGPGIYSLFGTSHRSVQWLMRRRLSHIYVRRIATRKRRGQPPIAV
jgi:hypothetical protein